MYQPNKPVLTAMTIIEGLCPAGMRITGYNTGDIVLTNLAQLAVGAKQKKKAINKKYLPPEKPEVTAITAIPVTSTKIAHARVFIGFSDASIFIIDVSLKKDGTPTNSKKPITIAQTTENSPVRAITILDNNTITIVLGNNKIKIINFSPTLLTCKKNKDVSLKTDTNPMIPLSTQNTAAAILPIQQSSGPIMYYVYALDTSNQLILCKYNQNFHCISNTKICDNVCKIAAPPSGNNFLIFSGTNNAIFQTSPLANALPQPINTGNIILSAGISAMVHTTSSLYIVTKNDLFATVSLWQESTEQADTRYDPIPAAQQQRPPPPLIDLSDAVPPPTSQDPNAYTMLGDLGSTPSPYTTMPNVSQSAVPLSPSSTFAAPNDSRSRAATAPVTSQGATGYGKLPGQYPPSSSSSSTAPPPLQRRDTEYGPWVQPQQQPLDEWAELDALIHELDLDNR